MNAIQQSPENSAALRARAWNAFLLGATIVALAVAAYRQRGSFPLHLVTSKVVDRHIRNATLGTRPSRDTGAALIFNASDCPASLELIDSLNVLAKSGKAVRGFMVGTSAGFPDWKRIPETFGMHFDVELLDPSDAAAILTHYGRRVTPLVLEVQAGQSARAVVASNSPAALKFDTGAHSRFGLPGLK
jgi:hypothetical protein